MTEQKDRSWTDAERLAALDRYSVLDTPPEQGFEDLAQLAASLLGAPMAAVNLIAEHRQWFKAEVGLGVREMPLDNSICARVLLQPGELVIPDLLEDERFNCNPLVTSGPGLRFYAGELLETPDGLPLGTLCVLDTKPRPEGLTDQQRFILRALARQVMGQLELRRAMAQQAHTEALQRQTLLSVTDFAIISTDLKGGVLGWNPGASKLMGWTEGEMVGQLADRIFTPEDREKGAPDAERGRTRLFGRAINERWHLRKDGSRFWGSGEMMQLRDEAGTHAGYVKVMRDRTEQHLAGETLAALNERYRLASRATNDVIWDWDLRADTILWNEALQDAYGWAPEQVDPAGNWWLATIHPEDRERVDRSIHAVIDGRGTSWTDEYRFRRADGSYADVLDRGYVIRERDGRAVRMIGAMLDLSERKRAETRRAALATLSDRIHDLDDPKDIAYAATQVIGEVLSVSRVGYSTVDPVSETMLTERDWTAPGVPSIAGNLHLRDFGQVIDVLKRGEFMNVADTTLDPQTAGGSEAFVAHHARSIVNVPILEHGELVALFFINDAKVRHWSAEDLAFIREAAQRTRTAVERARGEAALRESALQLQESARRLREINETLEARVEERTAERDLMWATSPDLLVVIDFDGVFRRVNPTWTTLLGYTPEELVGHHVNEFVIPDDHPETTEAYELAARGGRPRIANRYRHKDGSTRWISWVAAPAGSMAYATGRDVTAEKEQAEALRRTEAALRQSQKMEAVGQLTGGIAHDFNNLLTAISGSLDLLTTRISQGRIKDVDRYVNAAQGAAKRAASLTHRLLAFSRQQTLEPKPTNVNRLVRGMEELIRRTVGPEVDLEMVEAGGLWTTLVDPGQLENALLNLCINARDAMPGGGRITVETGNKWLDRRAAGERELPPGQYVTLCVSDTGTGMTPDVIAKAFDPFFTTKPIGQGTGLGLSMIYGFVRQSGGQVRIYSEVGQGTMVCLYLPRHLGAEEPSEELPELAGALGAEQGETVLVVDDEPTVRMLVTEVLADLGYTAIEAADGPAALRVLQSDVRLDLLVTDVGLPGGMNGREVADAARVSRPGLKVLFITGYAENAVLSHGHLDPGMHILTKPFPMETLATRIRELINGG
ncbi:PAS domain S-box protein [Muricoccus pecuniae]|uniref:histidine kinase n=1 Tax=Muricoccus pecuniae TaxID=693023 RepID=A0A840YMN7_9PROT|nr:PAS domain S-box protein [Roseomonas pecuniae]MBB5696333.1 PAS domain S-box-containing protein [Roseomonas pecuniae]